MKLTARIRCHNAWRRGENDDMGDAAKLGRDLDMIANEHDKLTEQNKMLREALQFIADTPEVRADECSLVARKALEEAK